MDEYLIWSIMDVGTVNAVTVETFQEGAIVGNGTKKACSLHNGTALSDGP